LWKGPGWESADDWAALVAAMVIAVNAILLMRPAIFDLMDRAPDPALIERVRIAALAVPDVMAIEKLKVRRAGTGLFVDLHVQSDPELSLNDAHIVSGKVKGAIRAAIDRVEGVLIHMEPYEATTSESSSTPPAGSSTAPHPPHDAMAPNSPGSPRVPRHTPPPPR
jgi:divalent metal cation (Fe/Co/Zn/Cd) transporter